VRSLATWAAVLPLSGDPGAAAQVRDWAGRQVDELKAGKASIAGRRFEIKIPTTNSVALSVDMQEG
jgi:hypothetical protein